MTTLALPPIDYLEANRVLKVADLFCGAGGFSKGAMKMIASRGQTCDLVCVNHWDKAIATHSLNLPEAAHFIEDVNDAQPLDCVPGGHLDLLLASPSCTFHSNARGGRPVHDQGRMDPFAIVNWLRELHVTALVVENVPEFRNWGPLCTKVHGHDGPHGFGDFTEAEEGSCGKPDPQRAKEYFNGWVGEMRALGYEAQWHILNAADFGDATTRKRFFLQARNDGRPIVWPKPTHADAKTRALFPHLKAWRAAREIIDWETPGLSVFDSEKYRKKPLAENTRRRMVRGLQRLGNPFWQRYAELLNVATPGVAHRKSGGRGTAVSQLPSTRPQEDGSTPSPGTTFVMGKQSAPTFRTLDEPMPTVTTQGSPQLIDATVIGANRNNNVPRDASEPVPPATTAPGGGLYLAQVEAMLLGQQSGAEGRSVDEPAPTIATAGAISLIIPYYHTGVAAGVEEPLATVTSKGRFGLVNALIIPYGPKAAERSVDEPAPTILSKDRLAMASAEAFVLTINHGAGGPEHPAGAHVRSAGEPLYSLTTAPSMAFASPEALLVTRDNQASLEAPPSTVTTKGAGYLVETQAFLVPNFSERNGQDPRSHSVEEPTPAVTGHVEAVILTTDQTGSNGSQARGVDEPAFTVQTSPNQAFAAPCMFAVNHGGEEDRAADLEQPLGSVTTKRSFALAEPIARRLTSGELDWRRLVIIDGQLAVLDLYFRMLQNRELARAMSFDCACEVCAVIGSEPYEFVGNAGEVTKQIGNAVPVHMAMALVGAAL